MRQDKGIGITNTVKALILFLEILFLNLLLKFFKKLLTNEILTLSNQLLFEMFLFLLPLLNFIGLNVIDCLEFPLLNLLLFLDFSIKLSLHKIA